MARALAWYFRGESKGSRWYMATRHTDFFSPSLFCSNASRASSVQGKSSEGVPKRRSTLSRRNMASKGEERKWWALPQKFLWSSLVLVFSVHFSSEVSYKLSILVLSMHLKQSFWLHGIVHVIHTYHYETKTIQDGYACSNLSILVVATVVVELKFYDRSGSQKSIPDIDSVISSVWKKLFYIFYFEFAEEKLKLFGAAPSFALSTRTMM